MLVKAQKSDPLPVGEYGFKVVSADPDEGNYGPQFKFEFEIEAPKAHKGRTLLGWTSQSASLRGKFMAWVRAIYNRDIEEDEEIDTDALKDRRVIGIVITDEGKDGPFNKITSLKAYQKQPPMPMPDNGVDGSEEFEVGDPTDPFENE